MTQEVSARNPGAVLGDFSGVRYRHAGVDARMDRDPSGGFRMTFTAADARADAAPPVTAIVSRAIGSRRYQQYLTRIGDAEYRLPIAYHVEEKRWLHMNGAFLFAEPEALPRAIGDVPAAPPHTLQAFVAGLARLGGPDYPRHVTRWNDNCVFCHNVAPNPGRDETTGAFRTEVAEMGIACEACHGPGAAHARANADPVRRYVLHLGGRGDPTIVNPSRLSPARAADLCGRCHGQRIADHVDRFLDHGDPFVPGDDLALWSAPLWQDTPMGAARAPFAPRFWADGTARLTAYEYQGLLQSPCTQRGALTCTSCHGMHAGDPRGQLRPDAIGDGACIGCHRELSATEARGKHSHHAADATSPTAVTCVDCHMPRVVYGVLDVHRSHRIEVPDPARAAAYGRPDACTGCHADQTPAWAAAAVRRWWRHGDDAPATPVDVAALAAAQGPVGKLLSGDPIERAVAADALGRTRAPAGPPALAVRTGLLLDAMANDGYPAVRHLAARALGRLVPSSPALAAYDPNDDRSAARFAAVERVRASLPPPSVMAPDPARARRLREAATAVAIDIGE
jgi:predicted CXXCH cytochrome family protein